jgi:hypothetical protein
MKILYSCISDFSKPCAQRTHVSEIVNNFAKLGHDVHLIALEKGDLKGVSTENRKQKTEPPTLRFVLKLTADG